MARRIGIPALMHRRSKLGWRSPTYLPLVPVRQRTTGHFLCQTCFSTLGTAREYSSDPPQPVAKDRAEMQKEVMAIIDRWFPNKNIKQSANVIRIQKIRKKQELRLPPELRKPVHKVWEVRVARSREGKAIAERLQREDREPTEREEVVMQTAKRIAAASEINARKAAEEKREKYRVIRNLTEEGRIVIDPKTKQITAKNPESLTPKELEAIEVTERCSAATRKNRVRANRAKAVPIVLLQTEGEKQGWLFCASSANNFQDEFGILKYRVLQLVRDGYVALAGGQRSESCKGFVRPDAATIERCKAEGKVVRVRRKWDTDFEPEKVEDKQEQEKEDDEEEAAHENEQSMAAQEETEQEQEEQMEEKSRTRRKTRRRTRGG